MAKQEKSKKIVVSAQITPEILEELKKEAWDTRRSVSTVIRVELAEWAEQRRLARAEVEADLEREYEDAVQEGRALV